MQPTWTDQPAVAGVTQPPVATDDPTGVESVSYDTKTAQGAPNNPKNAREVVDRGVANPQTVTDTEQVTSVDKQQTAPERKKLSYVEMFQQMSPYKPPTPEELEKERKKQKREAIFAAIGEGISAMSNLYFTTQYAPNAFDPSKGMAATTKARFDQLKKEREENQRQYMEGFMRAMRWDAEDERDERNWNHTLEREKVTDHWRELLEGRKQAKDEFDAQKRQLELQRLQGKISMEEYLTEQERLETEYMRANNMKMPVKPKPSTGGNRGGGGKKTSVWKAYNPTTGEEITIHATDKANAWSQCPQGFQIRQEPTTSISTRTQQNRRGKTTKSTTTTTTTTKNPDGKTGGVSSGKKPNPMGGGSSGGSGNKKKKKNPMS